VVWFDGHESMEAACERAIDLAGGGVPKVETIQARAAIVGPPVPGEGRGVGHVSEEGCDRSESDRLALVAAGFAPEQPLYERGTRVVDGGVQEARRRRQEFEAMPTVGEYTRDLIEAVDSERRASQVVEAGDLRMTAKGDLVVRGGTRFAATRSSFASLATRIGIGGIRYLTDHCWPELRAYNLNHQLTAVQASDDAEHAAWRLMIDRQAAIGKSAAAAASVAGKEPAPTQIKLLTRRNARHEAGREVYGVVSPTYQHRFGVDRVAEALARSMPKDARGEVAYDGNRARFRVLFHSDVRPEEYVAGEFFRVGISVRTDDTGGGSYVVEALYWQNLCLNMGCIDEGVTGIKRIRHVGSVAELERKFDDAMARARSAIGHFIRAWGFGTSEDVIARTLQVTSDMEARRDLERGADGVPIEEVLPGFFNGLIERELVPIRGRRQEVVPKLVQMYRRDESSAVVGRPQPLSRTAIVNAATRYAHEGQSDPWAQDDIQSAAGRLLFGRASRSGGWSDPAPLPYIPLS